MSAATFLIDRTASTPRRNTTRDRILAGAKEIFFSGGFAAAMMDDIAEAAGARRSTLYLHFREKDEMLAAIAADYTIGIAAVIAQLPSATPSRPEVRAWVSQLAGFVAEERVPTELLAALSHLPQIPSSARQFGDDFMIALGERLPAFQEALAYGGIARAWALAALENLCWSLCHFARHGPGGEADDRLAVSAELLSGVIERQV